ncbi:uncharacterized protein PITG_18249 [Phytophthora infestans T30-4]|uniref:Uncharacterized protein n=1 Tax=Phytophthora infestans (strain T30-4) TaxID=403677 RepID=D0NXQ1_PHYIT|nr:uncharacterized protein PITG_18249 [Phytophthora infestans T30-4]EEY67851.1 conserved hypothetical protein [Phytophthora infestans T30-4]|eukprot:XP_002997876.1 conserved hypothetical protein [Phytophthora infestans T30-4]
MAAVEPNAEGGRGDTNVSWALPDWEEYSEAASSSFVGDWSDVEADVSLDTASSLASTEHQRVYRIQRARGGFLDEKQRDLRELHSLYTRRRLEESFQGVLSVRSSANWLQPPPCVSPRLQDEKPLSPVSKQEEKQVENELLAQQSEISAELQAVRRQLSDFQDKWKKTLTADDAVTQWLLLLKQKLETLARKYSHEPTHNFQTSMTYLGGIWESNNDKNGSCTIERHERRQTSNFDRAIKQVQEFHQERMQKVVDESLAELKRVRGRYKKKETQLEDELRTANKEIEQWKQTATEAEHRKKLDLEALEFKFVAAKEQHDHICRRYEDEQAQLKTQLDVARAERKQVVSQHRDTHESISQAKEGAEALERQCQALKKQQERAKELHDREIRVLQDTIRQLRESKDDMESRYAKDKQALVQTIEKLEISQIETQELPRKVREERVLPEKLAAITKQHQDAVKAMQSEHEQQLAQIAAKLDETKRPALSSVRAIETQTNLLPAEESVSNNTQVEDRDQIEALTRRCRALEKLLDKKFEETSQSSQRCESCLSDDGISTNSAVDGYDLNASRSSIHSDRSFRPRTSGKSRALARALLGSSRSSATSDSKASPLMNETTMATDEATLGAHEMWDSASFTSIDTNAIYTRNPYTCAPNQASSSLAG